MTGCCHSCAGFAFILVREAANVNIVKILLVVGTFDLAAHFGRLCRPWELSTRSPALRSQNSRTGIMGTAWEILKDCETT
jgi:hypothetical protein